MNYLKITYPDVENYKGCRVTLWVAGCNHKCKGCHNPETWSFLAGKPFTDKDRRELFDLLSLPYIKGLTLSGGDPMYSYKELIPLLTEVRELFPDKDICLFTGFTLEEVKNDADMSKILPLIDVIIDGPYVESLRDLSLAFRGSKNQKIWKREGDQFVDYSENIDKL